MSSSFTNSTKIGATRHSLEQMRDLLAGKSVDEQLWRRALEHYEKAMELYNYELDDQERAIVQDSIVSAQEQLRAGSPTTGMPAPPSPSKRSTHSLLLIALIVLIFVLIGESIFFSVNFAHSASGAFRCMDGKIDIHGSTALMPLVIAINKDYESEYQKHQCRSMPRISLDGNASITGLEDVESNRADIGASDIFSLPGQEDLQDHQVAATIFVVIVNRGLLPPGAQNLNLSTSQLRAIYTGQATNWSNLPGFSGPNLSIVPFGRTPNSGTRYTFQQYVLKGLQTAVGVESVGAADAVTEVANTPGSISYTTLDKALVKPKSGSRVAIVDIDGIVPSRKTVADNQYNFWNIEHLYTSARSSEASQSFIQFFYQDVAKQAHNGNAGYFTPQEITPAMIASHPLRT